MFEILEHTADVGFRASGATREEMFESAALALEAIAFEPEDITARTCHPIAATGEDYESLLVNWLSEVLYYLDGRRVLMSRFRVERLTPRSVTGHGWGEPLDPARHRAKVIVKGITYHQLKIERAGGLWRATVYVDI